jgi:hypothetical protein
VYKMYSGNPRARSSPHFRSMTPLSPAPPWLRAPSSRPFIPNT